MFTTKKYLNGDELGISMKEIDSEDKSESHSTSPQQNQTEVEHWLYGELNSDSPTELPADKQESPTAELSSTEQAQQQLIHALLLQQKDTDVETNSRVAKVMSQLAAQTESSVSPDTPNTANTYNSDNVIPITRLWVKQSVKHWVSIAASVFVVLGFSFTLMLPSNEAMAAMDKVIETFSAMGDRVYDIKVDLSKQGKKGLNNKQKQQPKGNEPERKNAHRNNKKSSFSGGELYLSGNEQFVLIANNSPFKSKSKDKSKGKITGSNGIESWVVSGKGKVKTTSLANSQTNSSQKAKLPLARQSAELTFMNISEILKALKQSYQLTIEYNQQAQGISGLWSKISLVKRDNKTN